MVLQWVQWCNAVLQWVQWCCNGCSGAVLQWVPMVQMAAVASFA